MSQPFLAIKERQGPPDPGEGPQPPTRRKWLRVGAVTLLAISLVVLSAGATYTVIANKWATPVTGTFYSQSEREAAVETAHKDGVSEGHIDGLKEGKDIGYATGKQDGYESGYGVGLNDGYASGSSDGFDNGYDAGYNAGYGDGGTQSWNDGYVSGWQAGCLSLFTGLGTDRVGDWWDYYYSSYYGSYYTKSACN